MDILQFQTICKQRNGGLETTGVRSTGFTLAENPAADDRLATNPKKAAVR